MKSATETSGKLDGSDWRTKYREFESNRAQWTKQERDNSRMLLKLMLGFAGREATLDKKLTRLRHLLRPGNEDLKARYQLLDELVSTCLPLAQQSASSVPTASSSVLRRPPSLTRSARLPLS